MTIHLNAILDLSKQGKFSEALHLAQKRIQEVPDDIPTLLILSWLQRDDPLRSLYWMVLARQIDPNHSRVQKAWQELPPLSGDLLARRARNIVWPFKKINLPIQQALDEKKITVGDLAWAAQNARERVLRWASGIMASSLRGKLEGDMRPEIAFGTNWPLKQIHLPIEQAIRQAKIDFGDLCYAIVNGYNELPLAAAIVATSLVYESLREDAQPLSKKNLVREPINVRVQPESSSSKEKEKIVVPKDSSSEELKKPSSEKGKLKIIRGSAYLQEQYEKNAREKSWFGWMGRTIAILGGGLTVFGSLLSKWGWVAFGFFVLLFAYVYLVAPYKRARRDSENYRKGLAGEKKAQRVLFGILDSRWSLFLNVDLPDSQGDIDAVLVGPRGVYAIEIKAFAGYYRNRGANWEYKSRFGWRKASHNPSLQARKNARRLHDFFVKAAEIEQWVEPRVFWAGDKLWTEKPMVKIWQPSHVEWIQSDLERGKPVDDETQKRIHTALNSYALGYQHKDGQS